MEKLVLDEATAAMFGTPDRPVELFTASGRRLGQFVPAAKAASASDAQTYAWLRGQITDEELQRRRSEPMGRTTEEILRSCGAYEWAKSLWTDEEVEELSKQTGGISTEQLLERLSKL